MFDDGDDDDSTYIMLQRCHVRNRYALGLRASNVPNALTGVIIHTVVCSVYCKHKWIKLNPDIGQELITNSFQLWHV
jgi:hypothetical protein